MADTRYDAAGSHGRKQLYTGVIVVAAVVLAALVTLGVITREQIESFIELSVYLVGALGSVGALVAAALARQNVDPPEADIH